jgi:hypothetical protein
MNDEDLFEEDHDNIEENSDDRRERNLKNENQLEEQCKEYLKPFEDILSKIDEGVDNLDS